MANHCEKLVRKLSEKYFRAAGVESSSLKASNLIYVNNLLNLEKEKGSEMKSEE